MIRHYRKYLEPEYGPVAPEVEIAVPQDIDLAAPQEWRTQCHLETIAELVSKWKRCNCYPEMMKCSTDNRFIKRKEYNIPVRIYYPLNLESDENKILIFYHGGGYFANNADVYDQVCRYLTRFGNMTVICPEYRLSPESKFPEGLEDCYAALKWTEDRFPEGKIFVAGDSAGGNLAAAVAMMARDRSGPKVSGQILIYPITIFNPDRELDSEKYYGIGHFLEYKSKNKPLHAVYFSKEEDADSAYASPLCAEVLEKLPPACIISAGCDPLLDQALMYAARLEDSGVSVEYHLYKGMLHGFINRPMRSTIEALESVIIFVKKI